MGRTSNRGVDVIQNTHNNNNKSKHAINFNELSILSLFLINETKQDGGG